MIKVHLRYAQILKVENQLHYLTQLLSGFNNM